MKNHISLCMEEDVWENSVCVCVWADISLKHTYRCHRFKRATMELLGPVIAWNCRQAQAFSAISLFPNPHNESFSPQSPLENLQLLFCHVWRRGVGLKAEKQSGLSLTWIPKVSPPDVKIWTDLCSPRWSDPFISFSKVAQLPQQQGWS